MTQADVLTMLKTNLSIVSTNTSMDTYLGQLLQAGLRAIEREGIVLEVTKDESGNMTAVDDPDDANLMVMYAAWLFRKRAEDNPAMPRMLRYSLNNKLFSQKGKVSE